MKFQETPLPGCYLIELTPIGDERGYFMRTFCEQEFLNRGLNPHLSQASISCSREKGTLRGLHFQAGPAMEDKLVSCIAGAVFDVMVDLRLGSPTFGKWFGAEISESNHRQLYASKGFAHGFQALTSNVRLAYHIAQPFDAERSGGVRWNDPDLKIDWPLLPTNLSSRDQELPLLWNMDRTSLVNYEPLVTAPAA